MTRLPVDCPAALHPRDDGTFPDATALPSCQLDTACGFTMFQTLSRPREPYELRSRLKSVVAKRRSLVERFYCLWVTTRAPDTFSATGSSADVP
jgi:hypothetical protein